VTSFGGVLVRAFVFVDGNAGAGASFSARGGTGASASGVAGFTTPIALGPGGAATMFTL
jgi:hypothetical protein